MSTGHYSQGRVRGVAVMFIIIGQMGPPMAVKKGLAATVSGGPIRLTIKTGILMPCAASEDSGVFTTSKQVDHCCGISNRVHSALATLSN